MGKPVILPNVNIANLFQDGFDAILLKNGDPQEIANACITIFRSDSDRHRLANGARNFAEAYFEIGSQTKKLVEAYAEAISKFNSEETRELWTCLKSHGVVKAALMRVNHLVRESTVNASDLNFQLLKWCEQINARLTSTKKAISNLIQ